MPLLTIMSRTNYDYVINNNLNTRKVQLMEEVLCSLHYYLSIVKYMFLISALTENM